MAGISTTNGTDGSSLRCQAITLLIVVLLPAMTTRSSSMLHSPCKQLYNSFPPPNNTKGWGQGYVMQCLSIDWSRGEMLFVTGMYLCNSKWYTCTCTSHFNTVLAHIKSLSERVSNALYCCIKRVYTTLSPTEAILQRHRQCDISYTCPGS